MDEIKQIEPVTLAKGETVRRDFLASVVVFLVALPLCMGIAVASGAPPATGLITGIVGGIIVGLITGSPLQVSGPAAGLTVIVMDVIQTHGLVGLGIAVFIAGLIQMALGALRLGQVFRAVSPAVIQGMLAGIGVIIFASQFHVMVDDPKRGNVMHNLMSIPEAIQKGVVPIDGSSHHIAAFIGLLTIVAIVIWPMLAPKKLKMIPAPLVGVGLASAVALVFSFENIAYVKIPDQLADQIRWLNWENFKGLWGKSIVLSGVTVAAVASAETLLCASAVDQSQSFVRTKYDKELFAQGVGNSICGVLGALPMTGVIVRSSANVQAGGRTRLSTILHGFWLLIFVSALPQVIRSIPMSALGAMLVYTGYKLAHPAQVRNLLKAGWGEVAIYLITLLGIVVFDLLTGVIAGIVAAAIKLLWTFSHLRVRIEQFPDEGRAVIHLDGAATFIRLPRLAAALEKVSDARELHLEMKHLTYIDHACLELLDGWRKRHKDSGGEVILDWDTLHSRFTKPGSLANGSGTRTTEHRGDAKSSSAEPAMETV